jgi:LPS O-antigen subunit length determinant protein (WzzB/FepE family)
MKKNNSYLADKELDLSDLIKVLWKEKILIVFVSSICGLLGYLIAFSTSQELKVDFTITKKNENFINNYRSLISLYSHKPISHINIVYPDFNSYFLNLNNLKSFLEETEKLDNFRKYLKSRNITVEQYFTKLKFGKLESSSSYETNYFLIFTKELDENFFLDNYLEFTKKKIDLEFKHNLKLSIESNIYFLENIYEYKKISGLDTILNLDSKNFPIIDSLSITYLIPQKVLLNNINNLKNIIINLEKNQLDSTFVLKKKKAHKYYNQILIELI